MENSGGRGDMGTVEMEGGDKGNGELTWVIGIGGPWGWGLWEHEMLGDRVALGMEWHRG